MTDALIANYLARSATSQDDFIINKDERDANPMICSDGDFTSEDYVEGGSA